MPIAIKRRKLATDRNASSLTANPRIEAFTKVSKASNVTKAIVEKNTYVDTIAITHPEERITNGRKRKHVEEEGGQEDTKASTLVNRREVRPPPQQRLPSPKKIPQTPQKPIQAQETPVSADTPTKGARSLLDRFCISKTPTRSPLGFNSSSSSIIESTPERLPTEVHQELPNELLELINLQAAFLTALSIHYAHNGTHSPADLRMLCPDVARAWGKRRVTLEDIRRTLGVMNENISSENKNNRISQLSLSDYGHGKICIEIKTGNGKVGRIARPINEDLLNDIYVQALKIAWEKNQTAGRTANDFVESLPLEPITICPSLLKMSPLLAKGQRRLEDLRAGILIQKEAAAQKTQELVHPDGKKLTLLERLRAKQLHQSTLPPPASKAELARKAALQRIDEVVAVLTILSTSSSVGQQRISFTLPTVLGKLKDSFRTPISKEEGETCVRLLAAEIAPEWLKIVKMGKVEALVVNRDERPIELDIRNRISRAGLV